MHAVPFRHLGGPPTPGRGYAHARIARASPHLEEACQDDIVDGVRVTQGGPQRLRCRAGACAASGSDWERLRGNPMVLRILPAAAPRLVAHHYLPSPGCCASERGSNGACTPSSKQQEFLDTCGLRASAFAWANLHVCVDATI